MTTKRKCKLTDELCKEYPFIKKAKVDGNVHCNICISSFSITSGGSRDIQRHIASEKHKKALNAAASSSKVINYFRKEGFGTKEKELAISEAVFSYHTIFHNQSFRSMDCTSKIIQKLFEKKFSCARTKAEAIVKKVLAPYTLNILKLELENTNFISLFSDASNHKDLKIFPSLIRYFTAENGIQVKVLDFISLPGETAEIICDSILKILVDNNLKDKLVAFCADNANTNFGGVNRRGTNNIFSRLNSQLNQNIIGVGCAAHIGHNAILHAADLLPVDVQNIIIKIYGYFFIYTVRVETLKEFCMEAEVEYNRILGYSKTRWLALMPAIERVLQLFVPLRSYFLSVEKCPTIIEIFFTDSTSEVWLKFLHSQASLFHNVVQNIEGNTDTIMKVSEEIEILKNKCKERLQGEYLPLTIRSDLRVLEENGEINRIWFISHIKKFYSNCSQYLELWSGQFEETHHFCWLNLKKQLDWQEVQNSLEYIVNNIPNNKIDESSLFDEISYAKNYASELVVAEWNRDLTKTDSRWISIFSHFKNNNIPYQNLLKVVEYALCLPGTNAATERVFSLVNKIWTTEKSQLSIETVKAMVIVKNNLSTSCEEFVEKICQNQKLLKKIHSAEKYL